MFETIIGLEVHAQLNTKTKLWCSCATSFGEKPNTNICPTCIGLPGGLPTINIEAVHKAIKLSSAIGAKVNQKSMFNRKNYFYPDLPTGYQISQFEVPVVSDGFLDIEVDGHKKTIRIQRAHLENDAGKNIHDGNHSKVDLNRAGTPLLEIVTHPDMRSSDEAIAYLKKLHQIVRYIDISDANMQEGSFRCDVNISIRPKGETKLYTRCEIKNMNSFKFIEKAINYEVDRQIQAWEDGLYDKEVVQETRLFDINSSKTVSMRGKEDAADYRYFPDPDLLPLIISDEMIKQHKDIPELPQAKKERFEKSFGLKKDEIELLTVTKDMANYFEQMLSFGASAKIASSWLCVELLGRFKDGQNISSSPISAKKLAQLVCSIEDDKISGKAGKQVLDFLMTSDMEVEDAISKLGLAQISDDGAIVELINNIIKEHEDKVTAYKNGKDKLFGFFVGEVMKASKGKANPKTVNKLLKIALQG
ncbi:MAG: glutaminyl-tRNA synthase (glutamine-hydrolyzing) subunit B [Campylobacteraceae bacterium 4484_166]|nr:MAG: glutaminyl-tRNA synthase (glutamine-hydrolyzing) subunit B [Campylobacteraceae bacterium 4484_166]